MARNDALQGALPILVLKILAPARTAARLCHHHQIETASEVLRVEEGSLYPALHRLEEARLVKAKWVVTDQQPARARLRGHRGGPAPARGRREAVARRDARRRHSCSSRSELGRPARKAHMSWWSRLSTCAGPRGRSRPRRGAALPPRGPRRRPRGGGPAAQEAHRAGGAAVRPPAAAARGEPRRQARCPGSNRSARDVRLGVRLLRKDAVVSSARRAVARPGDWRLHGGLLADRRADAARAAGPRSATASSTRPRADADRRCALLDAASAIRSSTACGRRGAADGRLQHEPAVAAAGRAAGRRRRRREAAHAVRLGQCLRRARRAAALGRLLRPQTT